VVSEERFDAWSPADVGRWVSEALELPQYAGAFLAHDIDGPTLFELTDGTLEEYLGIQDPLLRKKIVGHIKMLKIKSVPSSDGVASLGASEDGTPPSLDRGYGGTVGGVASALRGGTRRVRRRDPATMGTASGAAARRSVHPHTQRSGGRGRTMLSAGASSGGGSASSKQKLRSMSTDTSHSSTKDAHDGAFNYSRSASTRSLGEESCIYTRHTNPNSRLTTQLSSDFGVDSPSFSRRGSFPKSARKHLTPTKNLTSQVPGPEHYQNVDPEPVRPSSPRVSFSGSPRNTMQYMVLNSASTTAGRHHSSGNSQLKPSKTGAHSFGTAPRDMFIPRRNPGPGDYHPRFGIDSTFRRARP